MCPKAREEQFRALLQKHSVAASDEFVAEAMDWVADVAFEDAREARDHQAEVDAHFSN